MKFALEHEYGIYRDYETTLVTFDDEGRTSVDLAITIVSGEPESAYLTVWIRNDHKPAEEAGTHPLSLEVAKGLING